MLRFLRRTTPRRRPAAASGPPKSGSRSTSGRCGPSLGPGPGGVEASARFAASTGGAGGPAKFGMLLAAFSGDPAAAPATSWPSPAIGRPGGGVKGRAGRRPAGGVAARSPSRSRSRPDADFLLIQARVTVGPPAPAEFAGHYLDDVQLRLLRPAPTRPRGR